MNDIQKQAQFIVSMLDDQINKIKIDTLRVVGNKAKRKWRAINKITIELYGDLKYKEIVRSNLSKLVDDGMIATKPSERKEDGEGTVKYSLTKKGKQYLIKNKYYFTANNIKE